MRSPREAREASSRAPRGRERANGVLGSSPGPSCNLHSSRNRSHRRPDERTNGIYPAVVRERVRGSRDDERAGPAILWPLPDRKARSVWDWPGFLRTSSAAAPKKREGTNKNSVLRIHQKCTEKVSIFGANLIDLIDYANGERFANGEVAVVSRNISKTEILIKPDLNLDLDFCLHLFFLGELSGIFDYITFSQSYRHNYAFLEFSAWRTSYCLHYRGNVIYNLYLYLYLKIKREIEICMNKYRD